MVLRAVASLLMLVLLTFFQVEAAYALPDCCLDVPTVGAATHDSGGADICGDCGSCHAHHSHVTSADRSDVGVPVPDHFLIRIVPTVDTLVTWEPPRTVPPPP